MSHSCNCVIVPENYCHNGLMTESENETYMRGACGNCGSVVHFEVCALHLHNNYGQCAVDGTSQFDILRCPSCKLGTVANPKDDYESFGIPVMNSGRKRSDFILSPGPLPARLIRGLPDDVERAWQEAIRCGQSAAWTATELMCRKILMHLAVDLRSAEEGKSFVEYVTVLNDAHYFPPNLQPIVDGIRQRGNRATHDLAASSEQEALRTLKVTEHVLASIYELPNI